MDKEDGEMSDDNAMIVDDVNDTGLEDNKDCIVLFKADKNGIIVEQLEKVDAAKLEERAKRFGLNITENRVITQRHIDELYSNFGIQSGNERHFRFDTINLNGIDGLTTMEIFQYLEDYKPVSLEWVDDISCNVVCQDHISAALALLVHSREIRDKNIMNMLSEKSNHHWREGMPHPKKDLILMRFATNADKKITKKKPDCKVFDDNYDQGVDSIKKNPWGDLCKSWGVYDHQEIFQRKPLYHDEIVEDPGEPERPVRLKNKSLAMRLGKRRMDDNRIENYSSSDSDSEWKVKSKVPRMRMHADDEESKLKKKHVLPYSRDLDTNEFAPLSIEVENAQRHYTQRALTKLSDKFKMHSSNKLKHSIQSRLGEKIKPTKEQSYSSDNSSSEHSDGNVMSRVHKVNSTVKSTANVWSRLDSKPNASSSESDLRQKLKSRNHKSTGDLRGRISKSKQSNLRIEIDNNYAHDL